ncbi:MAG: sigma-70 family RNA polymerase sigma factor [Planctomycetes bacterium]|nr:sigma-70 family RNA polymerase sigma factor [Planctomycetota bacterium]
MFNEESDSSLAIAAPEADFVQLFTKFQRRIYLFILFKVPSPFDADEILQETNLVIWQKCDQFRMGTNFLAWACQIATFEVLKFRDRNRRNRLYFSDEFIEQIGEAALDDAEHLEERRNALVSCLGKLREKDQELIQYRYAPGETGINLARRLGRPANSVYQSLGRIRRTLLECINRRLRAESIEAGQ